MDWVGLMHKSCQLRCVGMEDVGTEPTTVLSKLLAIQNFAAWPPHVKVKDTVGASFTWFSVQRSQRWLRMRLPAFVWSPWIVFLYHSAAFSPFSKKESPNAALSDRSTRMCEVHQPLAAKTTKTMARPSHRSHFYASMRFWICFAGGYV